RSPCDIFSGAVVPGGACGDDMAAYRQHRRTSAMPRKLRLISVTLCSLAFASTAAQPADDIAQPTGYRKWFHVNTMIVDKASPLFEQLGGMHNVYVNSVGEAALKKGGPYP